MKRRQIPISLRPETYRMLKRFKERSGRRTWDEFMEYLVKLAEETRELKVRVTMCNDLRESRASLPAWYRLLERRLPDGEAVAEALSYLAQDPSEPSNYVVDGRKCGEVGK